MRIRWLLRNEEKNGKIFERENHISPFLYFCEKMPQNIFCTEMNLADLKKDALSKSVKQKLWNLSRYSKRNFSDEKQEQSPD